MRGALIRLAGFAAMATGPAFGQGLGLGLSPALPEGPSALTVSAQAGPWMICAASYTGPPSRGQAEELATEIRTRYNLPAYVFNRTGEERRKEKERVERLKAEQRQRHAQEGLPADLPIHIKTVRIEDQYAVLVGGYKDDTTARKALEQIRKLKAPDKFDKVAYVPDEKGKMHEQAINPFQSAFVCRNPAVPVEKPKQDGPDPRLKEYNAGESYSLLKCGKPFTLVVRAYRAYQVVDAQSANPSVKDRLNFGKKAGEVFDANARQARQVAEFLRKFGVEAYVLHTEYSSYVTIGAFDSLDDPRLAQMRQWFVGEMNNPGTNVGKLHAVAMVQFNAEPMPMPVPQVK
jgi:SPOR domain